MGKVENQKRIISTAVLEYFPAQIAVARAGFVGFDCHQSVKNIKNCSISKTFSFFYCQFSKNRFWNDSMKTTSLVLYCNFMWLWQLIIKKASFVLSPKILTDSTVVNCLAFYCPHNSRNHNKLVLYCRPKSRPAVQLRIVLLSTVHITVENTTS